MPEQTSTIISKVWGLCNPLRDDGVSYGDYLEQLTYLILYYRVVVISAPLQGHMLHCKGCCGSVCSLYR